MTELEALKAYEKLNDLPKLDAKLDHIIEGLSLLEDTLKDILSTLAVLGIDSWVQKTMTGIANK